ncbi:hypothetical protein D3C86_1577040 [compost metagenome]
MQRALADVQRSGYRFHITLPLPLTQAFGDQCPNPADNGEAVQLVQLSFGKTVMQYSQRLVGHAQRTQKLLAIEQDAVVGRPETQFIAKQPLMLRDVFRLRIGKLHA